MSNQLSADNPQGRLIAYSASLVKEGGTMNDIYKFNKNLFKQWSDNMAYVLGWLITDGCIEYIPNERYVLRWDLADIEPLEHFKEIFNSNHPIHKHDRLKEKNSITYSLTFRDKEMVEDIINLGVTPDKTFNITIPDIPEKHLSHFIRGLFEGDGSVFLLDRPNNRKLLNTKIMSASETFIKQLGDIIKSEVGMTPKIYSYSPDTTNNIYWSLRYGGKESYALYKYMYDNAKYYLTRKKEVFQKAREIKAGIGLANCKRCGKEIVRLSASHKWCKDCKKIVQREQCKAKYQRKKEREAKNN